MKKSLKMLLVLLVMTLIFIGISWLLNVRLKTGLPFSQTLLLISSSFLISVIVSFIFLYRDEKRKSKGVLNTLISLVVKFLLFLVLLASFVLTSDKLDISFLVTFFILYLSYTFYLLFTFVSVLRSNKPRGADENGLVS